METVNLHYISGRVTQTGIIAMGTYLVEWYRQGDKLGVRMYHDDPDMLWKVSAKKHLTLVGEVEKQQHGMVREMRSTVSQWTSSGCITNPAMWITDPLPAFGGCNHEWQRIQLFTSSYNKCIKCGAEEST